MTVREKKLKGIKMIDTLRLIITLKCNMSCVYCCNQQYQFNSQFRCRKFSEIDFDKYKNVCITGGEPFLNKPLLYTLLDLIPKDKNVCIYTNGTKIYELDCRKLEFFHLLRNLQCVNIGLHIIEQLNHIPAIEEWVPVRWLVQNTKFSDFAQVVRLAVALDKIKQWKLNECEMPNEDWILLKTECD